MTVKHFLEENWRAGAPIVLACSGGPDSKALLYLLVEVKKFIELEVVGAHIDHGWREESGREAEELKAEVEGLNLGFYLKKLEGVPMKEEAARDARFEYLVQVASELGAQAVILGHQMDDQAETVLKRVLEGASFSACGGMKSVSVRGGMTFWRPLLTVSKKDLTEWLEERGISYFTDRTNLDPKYLRGRMRGTIVPQLEASFGKSIVKNLCILGERAQKLESHLERASKSLLEMKVADLEGVDDVVLEFFLKKGHSGLSREELAVLAKKLRRSDPELPIPLALKIQNNYLYL